MNQSRIYKIISLLMAFLMLVSSTGFSIDLHYCQGNIKSFSFLGKAKSCHTELNTSHCKKNKMACHAAAIKKKQEDCKKNCCSNKSIEISPDTDNPKIQQERLTESNIQFITAFVDVLIIGKKDFHSSITPQLYYVPPLLNRDLLVIIQSFLL